MAVAQSVQIVPDSNGNPQYIGTAAAGTAPNAPKWQIKKLTYDANGNTTSITWANGTSAYDKTWTSYSTYNYQ